MSQENKSQYQEFLDMKDLGVWLDPQPNQLILTANNPLCGDQISLHCKTDQNTLKIESMKGEGCSVCLASSGILYHKHTKWNLTEFISYQKKLENFLNDIDPDVNLNLEESKFWTLLKKHPGRYKCAFLPFQALLKGLKGVSL